MASIVRNNFDTFLSDEIEIREIRVPHYLARMLVKLRDEHIKANNAAVECPAFNKVYWIKFIREWYKETTQQNLGLKDALDIVDYYMTQACIPHEFREPHLQRI